MNEQNLAYIHEAKEKNLDSLALRDDQIGNAISELKDITHLKRLSFESCNVEGLSFIEEFKNLEFIEFTWCGVKDVTPLKYCTNLKGIHIREAGNQPEGLNELTFLENLESLSIGYYEDKPLELYGFDNLKKFSISFKSQFKGIILSGFNKLIEFSLKSSITHISLSGFGELEELYIGRGLYNNLKYVSLEQFEKLKNLVLGLNYIEELIIKGCKNLEKLDLAGSRLSSYAFLENLIHLKDLDLSSTSVKDLSFLSNLISLRSLNLAINENVNRLEKIDELRILQNLEILNLHANQIKDITVLSNLKNLKILNADLNYIESVESLTNLQKLETLNLQGNLVKDLTPIAELTNLKILNLDENPILGIEPLKNLYNLETLYLNGTQIQDISFLQGLQNLISLNLGGTQIQDISFLQGLENLTSLFLMNNQIQEISLDFLNSIFKLEWIELRGNPIQNIPKEIFDKNGNVLKQVREYLESIAKAEDRRELNEAKLIVVGVGDVGKSEIVEALSEDNYTFVVGRQTTQGIRIKKWYPKDCVREEKQISFTTNIWDFAGQEINYGTHQFFLTKNSVYIFVWETRKGEQQSKFDYWLNIISLLSNNAPILVVQNKVDIYQDDINQKDWKSKFPHIVDFYKTSCKSGIGLDKLRQELIHTLLSIPNTREIWNKYRFAVRETLENHAADYINHQEYLKICVANQLNKEQAKFLSQQLHDLGVILHFAEDIALKDTVVLKTNWATEAAYCLLDSKNVKQGRFSLDELDTIWQDTRFDGKHHYLIELIKKFELIFQLQDSNVFIVPEGLPIDAPEKATQAISIHSKKYLRFEYHYQFMPKGILSRFICRVHELIKEELFWKYGVELEYDNSQAKVILNDIDEIIRIEVWGENADKLLAIIRSHFQQIHQKLNHPPLTQRVPCLCIECKSKDKPYLHDYQTLKKFQEKGKQTRECANSAEDVSIVLLLEGIIDTQNTIIQQLLDLVDDNNIPDFFGELQHSGVANHQITRLRKEFIYDGGGFQYAERLKVWVRDYFCN